MLLGVYFCTQCICFCVVIVRSVFVFLFGVGVKAEHVVLSKVHVFLLEANMVGSCGYREISEKLTNNGVCEHRNEVE